MISVRSNKEDGSVLIMAVILAFVITLLGMGFLTTVARMQETVNYEISRAQAIYDSQTGAFAGIVDYFTHQPLYEGWRRYYTDNKYRYHVIPGGQHDVEYGTAYEVRFIGYGQSENLDQLNHGETQIQFGYESWADYLYISDSERDPLRLDIVRFWTPDTLDGKVHSNDTIHIQASADRPRFMKRVTTYRNFIEPRTNGARFDKGWGWHGLMEFPDQAYEIRRYSPKPYPGISPINNPGYFDSLTQIVFDDSIIRMRKCGKYVYNNDRDTTMRCYPDYIGNADWFRIPASGCLFVLGKVWLSAAKGHGDLMDGPFPSRDSTRYHVYRSGGFSGRFTLASSDSMIITDDLVYKRSVRRGQYYWVPSGIDSCSDVLGLISENYIMMGKEVNQTINVNAALAAIRGSITVQDIYDTVPNPNNNEKQSLFIHGSLAQRNRGLVHTSVRGSRGFIEKDYHYDTRLQSNPPPHFMTTKKPNLQYIEVADHLFD